MMRELELTQSQYEAIRDALIAQNVISAAAGQTYAGAWEDLLCGNLAEYGVGYAPVLGNIYFAKKRKEAAASQAGAASGGAAAGGALPPDKGPEDDHDIKWTSHGYKHFPDKNKSWKDIVRSTKDGPAKYSPDIENIELFERDAWETGIAVTNGKNWRVKAYDRIIGATNGVETRYVRIENSANTIHGHPISEAEYLKLLK